MPTGIYNHYKIKGNQNAKGNPPNKTSFKRGQTPWNKEKKMPKEFGDKIRERNLKNPIRYWLGRKRPEMVGEKNWNWRDGVSYDDKKYRKQYRQSITYKKYHREYNKNKIEKIREYHRDRMREQRKNPRFRLDRNMSIAIWESLKGRKNRKSWQKLSGYTLKDLIKHLENQFDDKMSWENYGSYWWIDHIRPRSLFNYIYPEDKEFKECWALGNLQPLEAIENIKKSNNYEEIKT